MKIPIVKPSTRAFIEEARNVPGYSLLDLLHGYIYGRWTYLYISIGRGKHPLSKYFERWGNLFNRLITKPRNNESDGANIGFADTYHAKAVPLGEAKKLVLINEDINLPDLEQVIPYKRARSLVMKNPDRIVALDCPCRVSVENPCTPLDVCLVVGDPFASFVQEHNPKRSRFISRDEAIQILKDEDERGHVHHAFFKDAMLERFYAICNCCECCCGAMHAHNHGTPMLASSGYVAQINEELCISCDTCAGYCQFGALEMGDLFMGVNYEACMGCGVCVGKCDQGAIILERDESKGVPLEICALMDSVPN